jgi:hypothetical protein
MDMSATFAQKSSATSTARFNSYPGFFSAHIPGPALFENMTWADEEVNCTSARTAGEEAEDGKPYRQLVTAVLDRSSGGASVRRGQGVRAGREPVRWKRNDTFRDDHEMPASGIDP